jgi:hypothetical protein
MPPNSWINRLCRALVVFLALQTLSCGTILHPERRGQPAGRLDPGIVLLDAVGLVLFFVPGVIAFAVDFSNGTIYLPPDSMAASAQNLQSVQVPPGELSPRRLESIVQEQTGQAVRLEPGTYRAARITQIEHWDADLDRLRSQPVPTQIAFKRAVD